MDGAEACRDCKLHTAALCHAQARIAELEGQLVALREQLEEGVKTVGLLTAELTRYQQAYNVGRPNCPERVPSSQLQLAFERVLQCVPPANDLSESDSDADAAAPAADSEPSSTGPGRNPPDEGKDSERGKRVGHGRRNLQLCNLPAIEARIEPPEVTANPELFKCIGEETSSRIGYRPACYVRLLLIRTKWVRIASKAVVPEVGDEEVGDKEAAEEKATAPAETSETPTASQSPTVHIATLPTSVLPQVMADPSAIANVIVSKYDDILPLHRQERISARHGFALPRSTQCGWLSVAFALLHRIVLAMFVESKAQAFCIATDATGAPVQKARGCRRWHVFTFIADNGHIVFRWVNEHSGKSISDLLSGFRGHLLSDASSIYDVLYRKFGIVSVYCWAHVRRGFWRALHTDKDLATEAMSILSKLFELERECRLIAMPERTRLRAERARPLLELFDAWIAVHNGREDIGDPLQKAIGYYLNQRDGLRRFLEDGRLPIHNNSSEGQLRNLAQGRDNWRYFINRTGLNWYTTFRSLIASCHLHSINPQTYLEDVLRLAPHWPVTQLLQLSPKYWPQTRATLNAEQLQIIRSPWDTPATPAAEPADASDGSDPTSKNQAA